MFMVARYTMRPEGWTVGESYADTLESEVQRRYDFWSKFYRTCMYVLLGGKWEILRDSATFNPKVNS